MSEVKASDIADEAWREYDFNGRVYRIDEPVLLYMRPGGTTHRVVDAKHVVHCCPAPGVGNCILRWAAKPGKAHVRF